MRGDSPAVVALSWVAAIGGGILARMYPWWALGILTAAACVAAIAWAVATTWAQAAEVDRLTDPDCPVWPEAPGPAPVPADRLDDPARAEWFALPDGRVVDSARREP